MQKTPKQNKNKQKNNSWILNGIISFWSTRTELISGTLLFLELHCNATISPQDGNLDATTFGVLLEGALGVSLSALKRRKEDDRASKATYLTNQDANASSVE